MHMPTLLSTAVLLAALAPQATPQAGREAYHVTPVEMLEVVGDYRLDDGGRLRVSQQGRRVFAELGGARIEVRPVAPLVFVSGDRKLRLVFTPMAFATGVLVTRTG